MSGRPPTPSHSLPLSLSLMHAHPAVVRQPWRSVWRKPAAALPALAPSHRTRLGLRLHH